MVFFWKKDKLQIVAFQSYGSDQHFYARGRALEDENIDLTQKGFFRLIWNTYKRFETDEIKNTPLNIRLSKHISLTGTTDEHGYFIIDAPLEGLAQLANDEGWLNYEISYADTALKKEVLHQNRFPGEMLVPSKNADFGVISDIDDTILHTGVVSSLKWRVVVNTIFKRAHKRKPLDGAAHFYHQLHRGATGKGANPIFYVSHSPWNLYRYLELFLKTYDFPKGPILLRSMASFHARKSKSRKPPKQREILNILETYPDLPFILIGDSGERDADIYIEIAKVYPKRILAIYLRNVAHRRKMLRVKELFEKYRKTPVLFVESSEQAIEHARVMGFIK